MSPIKIEETSIKLSASFVLGPAPLSYDKDDVGCRPRRIDFDVVSDLLSEMLLGIAGKALPADLMLRGVDDVYVDPTSMWREEVCVSIQASVGDAGEIYGPCWKSLIAEKMKGVITRFIAMTETPGALKWWELRTELDRRLEAHDNAHRGYMASDEFYKQQAEIREHPDFDNTEPPDFIGDVLLATKFAELDISITGKQVQGWKEYPLRFEDIVGSQDLIYLNDGGYSRMGLFINTDDTIRVVICMNEKSDHHGRQHDDDVITKMREIQEAATTWYRAALKEAGEACLRKKSCMEVNLNTVANRAADAAASLTNSLLTTDNGISEPQYRALIKLLGLLLETQHVERLTKAVRATDGQFYLPEGDRFSQYESEGCADGA